MSPLWFTPLTVSTHGGLHASFQIALQACARAPLVRAPASARRA